MTNLPSRVYPSVDCRAHLVDSLFFQGAKPSKVALSCSKATKKVKLQILERGVKCCSCGVCVAEGVRSIHTRLEAVLASIFGVKSQTPTPLHAFMPLPSEPQEKITVSTLSSLSSWWFAFRTTQACITFIYIVLVWLLL